MMTVWWERLRYFVICFGSTTLTLDANDVPHVVYIAGSTIYRISANAVIGPSATGSKQRRRLESSRLGNAQDRI